MTRRSFLGSLAAASLDAPRRPNIVFILIDDYGWRDTGYNGSTFYETPHVDALARTGMVFTDAYSSSPVCSPTRVSSAAYAQPTRRTVSVISIRSPRSAASSGSS